MFQRLLLFFCSFVSTEYSKMGQLKEKQAAIAPVIAFRLLDFRPRPQKPPSSHLNLDVRNSRLRISTARDSTYTEIAAVAALKRLGFRVELTGKTNAFCYEFQFFDLNGKSSRRRVSTSRPSTQTVKVSVSRFNFWGFDSNWPRKLACSVSSSSFST